MATPNYAPGQVTGQRAAAIDEGLRAHMNKVYALMGGAMVITGFVAYFFGMDLKALAEAAALAQSGQAVGEVNTLLPVGLLITLYTPPVVYGIMFAPLVFCFLLGPIMNRTSVSTAQTMFWVFAAIMGLSLASIFVRFTGVSIAQAFFATAAAFGALSIYGYTTNKSLQGLGTFAIMGLIGAIVLMILNMFFFESSALGMALQVVVLLASCALTAYHTQQIKSDYIAMSGMQGMGEMVERSAIFGALGLYINFINIFISLLSLFGQSNE
ncbi:MAG: Bax inhibitor-1/YccA family protein [Pseudomonadota bacterium]